MTGSMQNPEITTARGTSDGVLRSARLFSRDVNYLRDLALFWPFVISSIVAVSAAFSQSDRQLAFRCGALAVVAILLAKEKLLLFLAAMALVAIRGTVWLIIRPWSWSLFAVTALTGVPFLIANRFWRNPKLAYQLPSEFRLVDALLCVVSLCGTLYLIFLISPHKWGAQ
jgi:hypothetical protein